MSSAPNQPRSACPACGAIHCSFGSGAAANSASPRLSGMIAVARPVQHQDRRPHLPDARQRVVAVRHQPRGRNERVMILRGRGDAGIRRFEHHRADLRALSPPEPRSRCRATRRTARAGVQARPAPRQTAAPPRHPRTGRPRWVARIAAIAAIFEHQHPVTFAGEPFDAVGAIADMAGIAVKIDDDRPLAPLGRQIPREQ